MVRSRFADNALVLGIIVGLTFGAMDLIVTWLFPLADDTPGALLTFYGPMFVLGRSPRSERHAAAGDSCLV
jgi:hypothetical protein